MDSSAEGPKGQLNWAAAAPWLVVMLVLVTYWPVMHADFVWDDVVDFREMAWLRHGDHWMHFLLQKFNYWPNYFRPLVVGLFTLEVRTFNGLPGPMHAVSLLLHLVTTACIGLLSRRLAGASLNGTARWTLPMAAMLFYGMHPVMIEPVTWIGCQFDLTMTLLTIAGLAANTIKSRPNLRASLVALCFFLAACAKESAISFPLLIALFDLMNRDAYPGGIKEALTAVARKNWRVYAGMLLAGIAYLALRHWALGSLITEPRPSSSIMPRLQEVSYLYLRYWRMLLVPMPGMNPLHLWPDDHFQTVTAGSALILVGAVLLLSIGVYLALRRSIWGGLILAVTIGLFPVLHVIPAYFDPNLFHERYAMTALSMASLLLPSLLASIRMPAPRAGQLERIGMMLLTVWTLSSVASVRSVVPLWSSNLALWQWAVALNPDSNVAMDGLITAYVNKGEYANARRAFISLGPSRMTCTNCVLNIALTDIPERRLAEANELLEAIRHAPDIGGRQMTHAYQLAWAKLRLAQGDYEHAAALYRAAAEAEALDPEPWLGLAASLALQGKFDQAREMQSRANGLLPADQQASQEQAFQRLLQQVEARNSPPQSAG